MKGCVFLSIPNNYRVVLLQSKKSIIIYTYNKLFFFKTKLNGKDNVSYDEYTKGLVIKTTISFNLKNKDIVNYFLKKWSNYFIKKIRFTGKGFKIVKKRSNFIKFFFGKSHITWALLKGVINMKIKKRKILFIGTNLQKLTNFLKKITKIKSCDLYTKRGLRLGRQLIHKRNSKKNSFR